MTYASENSKGLKSRLAEHGFITNDDYEYSIRCFLSARIAHLRCLNIVGDGGRRKTAFCQALAKAIGLEHVLYHEFFGTPPTPKPVRILPEPHHDQNAAPGEPPVNPFDQIIGEACALSEGEPTALIIDQLHQAPFFRHLELSEFIQTGQWTVADMQLRANRSHLHIFLISDEPLFHSVQQLSFNLWIGAREAASIRPSPAELGLTADAQPVLDALAELFGQLELAPTWYEYQRLMFDVHANVVSLDNLKTSIFGWIEDVNRQTLYSAKIHRVMETVLAPVLAEYLETKLTDVAK